MKKSAIGLVMAGGIFLTGCGTGTISPTNSATEDCDAEDFRNMEDDCGFTQADRDRAKKKKLKTSSYKSVKKITIKRPPRH